jgi:hypothetical protein
VPAALVSEPSPLLCARGSVAKDAGVKDSGDLQATEANPATACLGAPTYSVSEPLPSVCARKSIVEDVGVKVSGDSTMTEVIPATACLGASASSVSEPSLSVCVRGSVVEDVGVKDFGDAPATEATHATAATGDGLGDGNGSTDGAKLLVPSFHFPFAEDFLAGFLSRDWEDFFSSRPTNRLGVSQRVFCCSLGGGRAGEPFQPFLQG